MSVVLQRRKLRDHPELSLLPFDLWRSLSRVRGDFPELATRRVEVRIQRHESVICIGEDDELDLLLLRSRRREPLACLGHDDETASITLHPVLNHQHTPEPVIAFILCHELLHLVVPPREVDGKRMTHPPEFWDAEKRLAPNRLLAWDWIWLTLWECLKRDERHEATWVKRNWQKRMKYARSTVEEIQALLDHGKAAKTDSGTPLL